VDEVAAAHLNADGVIHFGHTCLTLAQVTIPRYNGLLEHYLITVYNQGTTARLVIEKHEGR
jgi:diphthamide biosynthesis enzyme Dph1/Dph2-like protein